MARQSQPGPPHRPSLYIDPLCDVAIYPNHEGALTRSYDATRRQPKDGAIAANRPFDRGVYAGSQAPSRIRDIQFDRHRSCLRFNRVSDSVNRSAKDFARVCRNGESDLCGSPCATATSNKARRAPSRVKAQKCMLPRQKTLEGVPAAGFPVRACWEQCCIWMRSCKPRSRSSFLPTRVDHLPGKSRLSGHHAPL